MSDQAFVLNRGIKQREYFDPSNRAHLEQLKMFKQTGRWQDGCPFFLETPYLDIPNMCAQRFLEHSLK